MQGWDKYCPVGKFQWKMPDNAGKANTRKTSEKVRFFDVLGPHVSKFPHF